MRHPSSLAGGQTSDLSVSSEGPDASFAWASNGYNVTFTDLSTDNRSTITGWDWEFGDGTGYSGMAPPTHTYATTCSQCTEEVSLAVTDTAGDRSVATTAVVVQQTGASDGRAQSSNSSARLPSLGPLTSNGPGTVELLVIMFLIGGSTAIAARHLLRDEPEATPVRLKPS